MKTGFKRGQSLLEYTLILAAVIGILALVLFRSGGIQDGVEDAYEAAGTALNTTVGDLDGGIFQPGP